MLGGADLSTSPDILHGYYHHYAAVCGELGCFPFASTMDEPDAEQRCMEQRTDLLEVVEAGGVQYSEPEWCQKN